MSFGIFLILKEHMINIFKVYNKFIVLFGVLLIQWYQHLHHVMSVCVCGGCLAHCCDADNVGSHMVFPQCECEGELLGYLDD